MDIVRTTSLTKIYGKGHTAVAALNQISITIRKGEFVAVMGPSGCGKSTLLHLIGGLDTPTSGQIFLHEENLAVLDDDTITTLRRRDIGFIFQFYNLIPVLNAVENAALPLVLDGLKQAQANDRARLWLERVGLAERIGHRPDELSGGEQQRVAIARALTAEPSLILADEPTGNLDSRSADDIARLLSDVVAEWGHTILMVTHDPRIAAHADRIIFLKDGAVADDTRLGANGRSLARAAKMAGEG